MEKTYSTIYLLAFSNGKHKWPQSGDEVHLLSGADGEESECSVVDSGHLTRSST